MAQTIKDLGKKLGELGLKVVKTVEKGVVETRKGIERTLHEDELHRRFNLENPYRFEIREADARRSPLAQLATRNAKRYDEDDIFVFYGTPADTGLAAGFRLRDLSDGAEYVIESVVPVTVPVTLKDARFEVPATAAACRGL